MGRKKKRRFDIALRARLEREREAKSNFAHSSNIFPPLSVLLLQIEEEESMCNWLLRNRKRNRVIFLLLLLSFSEFGGANNRSSSLFSIVD